MITFRNSTTAFALLSLGLTATAVGMIVISSGMGYITITPAEVLRVLIAAITGQADLLAGLEPVVPFVVMDVRLPRILTAALVGGGLAVAGVVYQGILLNPLADPYTLGISSGAAFGASIALLVNVVFLGEFSVPLFAFVGALLTLATVLKLSTFNGQMSANTLILSGVIVGAILVAGISFTKYMADEQVAVIIFWLMGSFAARDWLDVLLVSVAVVFALLVAVCYGRDLDIMSLGSRSSDSLGVDTARTRKILLITASLMVAVCVSVSGIIGFVGLIVPHLMRFLVGPNNRRLVLVSFFAGTILLLLADTVTRVLLPSEVPIGILTALIGGPFFCVIFRRRLKGVSPG